MKPRISRTNTSTKLHLMPQTSWIFFQRTLNESNKKEELILLRQYGNELSLGTKNPIKKHKALTTNTRILY